MSPTLRAATQLRQRLCRAEIGEQIADLLIGVLATQRGFSDEAVGKAGLMKPVGYVAFNF